MWLARPAKHILAESVHVCLAMQALTAVIERSKETTMMGIERELKDAAASLERYDIASLTLLIYKTLSGRDLRKVLVQPMMFGPASICKDASPVFAGLATPAMC